MKTSQRKKIIIGYRYDPESYTSQRLQEVQSIENDFQDDYLPTDSVKKSFESDQKLIEKLRNENSLLKTELLRVEEKSSFRSYQLLLQQYKELESECNQLRSEVEKMKNTIKEFEQVQKEKEREKKEESNKKYTAIDNKNKEQEIPYHRNNHISYTFSPYTHVNQIEDDDDDNGDREQQQQEEEEKFAYYEKLKSIETNRNTTTDESLENRFYDTLPRVGQNNVDININEKENSERQTENIYKNYETFNPAQYKFLNTIIDSEYLYNDLKTINSEKSQELESQIHLGYNFSFMPKPLVKNIKTLQAFEEEETKKVSFKDDKNATFASSEKKMLKKDHQSEEPTYSINITEKSLCVSENQSESNIGKLNGLKKLPNKPSRNNERTSNNSISISDS